MWEAQEKQASWESPESQMTWLLPETHLESLSNRGISPVTHRHSVKFQEYLIYSGYCKLHQLMQVNLAFPKSMHFVSSIFLQFLDFNAVFSLPAVVPFFPLQYNEEINILLSDSFLSYTKF